jgi:anti-sigma factor RsiW
MPPDTLDPTSTPGPLDCQATVRRLWDYLDGTLATPDLRAVDAHLAGCPKCPPHFAFERAFLRAVRAARAEHVGADALRARVTAALALEGFQAR